MSFGSRLRERREALGLKQSELGKMLGITGAAIGNYENGISSPKADILYQVFDVLKCDANYLFQDEIKELETDDFTVPEIRMVKKYRTLDEYGKETVDSVLDIEARRCGEILARQQAEAEAAEMEYDLPGPQESLIEIRFYPQRVSAGYGEWLDEMDSYTIQVPDTPTTRRADFCLKVEGDSMEPRYSDGDLVFVKEQEDVEVGEYGIWIVDGYAYLKKRGEDTLISLNPDYDDVEQGEDVRCAGKVIGKL